MLFGTLTKTCVGWIAWTKISASTESLSTLRNGFRREVVDICRRKHLSRQRRVDSVGRQILVAPRKLVKVPEPIRFDGQGNYSASNLAQRRCLYCGMKVKFFYEKWNVGFTLTIFLHTQQTGMCLHINKPLYTSFMYTTNSKTNKKWWITVH